MAPKIVDKTEKRHQIAQAASRVFGEKGFERTRMEDVARAAYVGKGTIYEYFKDKDELLHGSFAVFVADIHEEILSELDMSAPPMEVLRKLSEVSLETMRRWGEDYRFFLEYMLHVGRTESEFPLMGPMLTEFRQTVAEVLRRGIADGTFRKDIEVEKTAAALIAWFDGAVLHWIVMPDGPSMEQMAKHYLEMMFRGLLADPDEGGNR